MPNSIARETVVTEVHYCKSSQILRIISFLIYFILLCTSSNFTIKGKEKKKRLFPKRLVRSLKYHDRENEVSPTAHTSKSAYTFLPVAMHIKHNEVPYSPKTSVTRTTGPKKILDREIGHAGATRLDFGKYGKYDAHTIYDLRYPYLLYGLTRLFLFPFYYTNGPTLRHRRIATAFTQHSSLRSGS